MATKNVLSVSSDSIECDLACEIVGDTGGKDIYIGDSTYTMYVTIRNEGSTSYQLNGTPSRDNNHAHFELNFSAHILLAGTYENETYPQSDSQDWAVTQQTVSNTNYVTNLYLFYTSNTPLNLPPNGTLVIPIQYRTDTESDAETCRITVKPGNDQALWSPPPGCAAGMQVTEDVTAYTFQLTAFVVGGDTLLNDGDTENRFTLRLLNPTTTPILLQPNTTAFEISIDTNDNSIGLCTADQARAISVTTTANGFNAPTYSSGNNVPRSVWTVKTANQNTPIVIAAAGSVDFSFTRVKTERPPGRSMIYVRCVAVPSMGGQVLIASVEKSPALSVQGTGTDFNAAQLLYAPSTVGSGGSGLLIKGAAQSSGSLNLLQIDGTHGHTGLSISNIGGSAYGLHLSGNTSSPVVKIEQNSTTNYSLRADGGWGVGIYGVNPGSSGLYVELSSSNAGVKAVQSGTGNSAYFTGGAGAKIDGVTNGNGMYIAVNTSNKSALEVHQSGTHNSAIFYGGAGVSIETITGNNRGLNIAANSSIDGLKVSQTGSGNSALFSGGAGILIQSVGTNSNGLHISVSTSSKSALEVNQAGSGNSAYFSGGGGVKIDGVTSGNGLYLSASTASDALYIHQGGTGKALNITGNNTNQALYVTQSNTSGMAAKFSGKVEIDGDVVIKGKIYLGTTNANIVVMRGDELHGGPSLILDRQDSTSYRAGISVMDVNFQGRGYWSDDGSEKDYIYYQSGKGLTIVQNHGPNGIIDTQ